MSKCDLPPTLYLQIAVPVPLDRLFEYLPPIDGNSAILKPGIRVLVPFGKNHKVGILLAVNTDSAFDPHKLKRATAYLDEQPLLAQPDIELLKWASHYYHHPIGEVMASAFPVALRQGKPAALAYEASYALSSLGQDTLPEQLKRSPNQQALLALFHSQPNPLTASELTAYKPALKSLLNKNLLTVAQPAILTANRPVNQCLPANTDQQAAIDSIIAGLGQFSVSLLEGVTGSGKTEVYMQAISAALAQGLQILVLLPEITLTPQLEHRFRQRFSATIVTYHSKLTDKQRLQAWLSMQQGQAAIMLGTRSALFTPLQKPGLLILDEEHDSSFKQQEGFRFSARDVAIIRARQLAIPVVLGSATPSLESLFNSERNRFKLLKLPYRAANAVAPDFQVLDIRNKKMQGGMSEVLLAEIQRNLALKQQVLLFINRRGFAPVQICHGCGWVSRCQRCDANLVIHDHEQQLRCHHCGEEQPLLKLCPACKTGALQPVGMGTERIEQVLNSIFPDQRLVRLDKDTTLRKGTLEKYLAQINAGEADIILGTQMLAKGHHFPNVTLVAILDIDSGLFSIDYRAGEKLAQMILQVAGRAGRAEKPGRVILQTCHPQHPLLTTLLSKGYRAFAEAALQERQQAMLPPFSYQALIRAHATNSQAPPAFLQALGELLHQHNHGNCQILGPVAAPMLKRAGQYRFQLLLQSPKRQALHDLLDSVLPVVSKLKEGKAVRWSVDIDPVDLY